MHNIYWGININFTQGGKGISMFRTEEIMFAVNYFIFPRERDIEFDFFLYKLQGEDNI